MTVSPPIQCSIALRDEPTQRLRFESFPETISEGYNVAYRPRRGRTSATTAAHYSSGDYDAFNLKLTFYAGLNADLTAPSTVVNGIAGVVNYDAMLQDMEKKVRWLEALCLPKPKRRRISSNRKIILAGEPPYVLITIGRFLTITGKVTRITTVWKGPFHPETARPRSADVNLSIKRIFDFYPDWYDVAELIEKRPLSSGDVTTVDQATKTRVQ
jgi:hypothetical protein